MCPTWRYGPVWRASAAAAGQQAHGEVACDGRQGCFQPERSAGQQKGICFQDIGNQGPGIRAFPDMQESAKNDDIPQCMNGRAVPDGRSAGHQGEHDTGQGAGRQNLEAVPEGKPCSRQVDKAKQQGREENGGAPSGFPCKQVHDDAPENQFFHDTCRQAGKKDARGQRSQRLVQGHICGQKRPRQKEKEGRYCYGKENGHCQPSAPDTETGDAQAGKGTVQNASCKQF